MARTDPGAWLEAEHAGLPGWAWVLIAAAGALYLHKRRVAKLAQNVGAGIPARHGALATPVGLSSRAVPVSTLPAPIAAPFLRDVSPSSVIPAPSNALPPLAANNAANAALGTNNPNEQSAFNQSGGFGAYVRSLPPGVAQALASLAAAFNAPSNPAAVDRFIVANQSAAAQGLPYFSHSALSFEGMDVAVQTIQQLEGTVAGQELAAGYLPAWYAAETNSLTASGVP